MNPAKNSSQDTAGSPAAPSGPKTPSLERQATHLETLMELTRSLATQEDIFEILFSVVSRLADLLDVKRGSIVLRDERDPDIGVVVATSDDASMRNHRLPLGKYPEIQSLFQHATSLVFDDVRESSLLREVLSEERAPAFSSMALVPIIGEHGPVAALVLKSNERARFSEYDLMHAQAVANATAIALNNAQTLRRLRDESRRLASAQSRDRERLSELSRYLDVFESARDAMLVVNASGSVIFANPMAAALTGRDAEELVGTPLSELFDSSEARATQRLVLGFENGEYPARVDFMLAPPAPSTIASVSFSQMLSHGQAVLVTMRDVTSDRAMAHELAQTKEFLERVIESSVDGIVSADLQGNVLLYNKAASRIFGYRPEEVLSRLTVDRLYPPGVARDIMRRIRRPGYGGEGRLEEYRVEMLAKSGERVPVNLSASLVMDAGRAVGTVGIFADIRQQLMMESRLAQAQQQLEERRRTDAIMEVAGAAAHELNQPLTSVMGYADYLKRLVEDDDALRQAVHVIQSETQRMAEIVRKVGRITRYETKPYVGGTKIVDLDRSSDSGS